MLGSIFDRQDIIFDNKQKAFNCEARYTCEEILELSSIKVSIPKISTNYILHIKQGIKMEKQADYCECVISGSHISKRNDPSFATIDIIGDIN